MRLAECGQQPSVHPPTTQKLTLSFTPFSCLSAVGTPPPSSFVLRQFSVKFVNNRYQPSWVCFGDGFSAEITPVFAGILGHRCLPKAEEIYWNVITEMLSSPYLWQNSPCCANSPASPPPTISISKRKRSLWPSSPPPLLCATSSGTQSRRASTYLQGNSRVVPSLPPS